MNGQWGTLTFWLLLGMLFYRHDGGIETKMLWSIYSLFYEFRLGNLTHFSIKLSGESSARSFPKRIMPTLRLSRSNALTFNRMHS